MTPVWAQRREELWSDCLVSPDVFHEMVDRLGEFVMPYQQALETEANPHSMHFSLQGLLSHLPRNRGLGRCQATGPARLYRYRAMGPPAVDWSVGGSSGQAVGRARWDHRLRSEQFSQARHTFGGCEAPMVRPPGQGRQLPGRGVHGLRLAPRPCLARFPFVPAGIPCSALIAPTPGYPLNPRLVHRA